MNSFYLRKLRNQNAVSIEKLFETLYPGKTMCITIDFLLCNQFPNEQESAIIICNQLI